MAFNCKLMKTKKFLKPPFLACENYKIKWRV